MGAVGDVEPPSSTQQQLQSQQPVAMNVSVLHDSIDSGRFADIGSLSEGIELELAASGLEKPDDWPYVIHLLGYIYVSDLSSARFLWKRIPANVKQNHPELIAAWKIGQCMWTYDHAGVHEALRSYSWSPAVKQLVAAIAEDYSRRIMKLLSTAYSTISVSDAARFLGLTEDETIRCTMQEGWTLDSVSKMLIVQSASPVAEQTLDSSNLQNLTEYVFHLEH